MIDDELTEAFARARAMFPQGKTEGSAATQAEWAPALRRFSRTETIEAFRALALERDRFPSLRQLLDRIWDRRRGTQGETATIPARWQDVPAHQALEGFDLAAIEARKDLEMEIRSYGGSYGHPESWIEAKVAEVWSPPGGWEARARLVIEGKARPMDWRRWSGGGRGGIQSLAEMIGQPPLGPALNAPGAPSPRKAAPDPHKTPQASAPKLATWPNAETIAAEFAVEPMSWQPDRIASLPEDLRARVRALLVQSSGKQKSEVLHDRS